MLPAAQLPVTVPWDQWWGAHVWRVMGGLRASLGECGTRTSRNDD